VSAVRPAARFFPTFPAEPNSATVLALQLLRDAKAKAFKDGTAQELTERPVGDAAYQATLAFRDPGHGYGYGRRDTVFSIGGRLINEIEITNINEYPAIHETRWYDLGPAIALPEGHGLTVPKPKPPFVIDVFEA
jgi:hypothetical protein